MMISFNLIKLLLLIIVNNYLLIEVKTKALITKNEHKQKRNDLYGSPTVDVTTIVQ